MVHRRTVVRGLLGAGALGVLPGVAAADSHRRYDHRRVLLVYNPSSRKQRIEIRVDGRVRIGPDAERDEDRARYDDGRGRIRSVLDGRAFDSFFVFGRLRSVDWERQKPKLWLDGWPVDVDKVNDRDKDHDYDEDHDRDHDYDEDHDRDRDRDKDHDYDRDHDRDRDRDKDHDRDHDYDEDHDRDRDRDKDHDYDRDHDRDWTDDDDDDDEKERGRGRGRGRGKNRGRGRGKNRGRGHGKNRGRGRGPP